MLKFNCSSLVVARWLLVAAVWVFAALLSAPTAFAIGTWRYVSLTGNDSVKTGPNSCADQNNPCGHINWAVEQSQSGDLIVIGEGEYDENITVSKNLQFHGAGAPFEGTGKVTSVNGSQQGSVFTIQPGVAAEIHHMLIINGKNSDGKGGGGIQNHGTLTVVTVTVRQNESTFTQFGEGIGGGISNLGSLNLYQVRLRENKLWGLATNGFAVLSDVDVQQNEDGGINSGGGYLRVEFSSIENNKGPGVEAHGTLDMVNVTISGNDSGSPGNAQGGLTMNGFASLKYVTIYANGLSGSPGSAQGIRVTASPGVTLYNSIVYGNGNGNAPQCGSGVGVSPGVPTPIVLIDGGYNVIEDGSCSQGWPTGTSTTANPKLNPLAEGFLTFTNALSLGSSAIDRVPQGQCGVSQDQRESNRPVDGNSPPDGKADCDAGAYEFTP